MTQPLWQKAGIQIDAKIMQFLAGDDVLLDREFFLHDVTASKAHVEGLANIGVVSADEAVALKRELDALADDFTSGAFVLDERYEDGHSAIEARLTERLGDAGRRVHTGRSRNDQILVATRLWLKDKLAALETHCRAIAEVCLGRAAQPSVPMPGYPEIRLALALPGPVERILDQVKPTHVHIATEGPIGFAVRAACRRRAGPAPTRWP